MKYKLKKAAMFGLDARIALAIFGALSVVSGAALYNAIQQAKVTALVTELKEVGKAWEQYYLDTGVEFVSYSTDPTSNNSSFFLASELISSNKPGWAGPYLNYEISNTDSNRAFNHKKYNELNIQRLNNNTDWGGPGSWGNGRCDTNDSCFIWVKITGLSESIAKKAILMIDNNDIYNDGNSRWVFYNNPDHKYEVFLKIAPTKNPNN